MTAQSRTEIATASVLGSSPEMSHLYINGRFLSGPLTGVQRYGRELLRELDAILAGLKDSIHAEVLVPTGSKNLPQYRAIPIRRVGFLNGHAWEQLELPFYCRGHVLFTPSSAAPLLHSRNVVTIHDAAVFSAPNGYSLPYRIWYRILGRVLCRSAIKILTVSEFSKQELLRWCCRDDSKIAIIYEGREHAHAVEADSSILGRFSLTSGRYVFAAGSNNPNKNFRILAQVLPHLRDLGYDVAVAGNHDDRVFRSAAAKTSAVKELGSVTDAELRALYENAACFVFPSLYEGFGLPPLEALSLGCPVVVSDRASMPEVFGGLAQLCNPNDPEDIAKQIIAAIGSAREQRNSEAAMDLQLARFSWRTCARETWEVLEECLSKVESATHNKNFDQSSPLATSNVPPLDNP